MKLQAYYNNHFENDVSKLQLQRMSSRKGQERYGFTFNTLLNSLSNMDLEKKINFLYSLFITVASDQVTFKYFRSYHRDFTNIVGYPKFICDRGMCMTNANPFHLIIQPMELDIIKPDEIEKSYIELIKLFKFEVEDFFRKYQIPIKIEDFCKAFTSDEATINLVNSYSQKYPFLVDILNAIEK